MEGTLAQQLGMRLYGRHAALHRMQWLDSNDSYEHALWGRVACRWLACADPRARGARSPLVASFREEAEALVLLSALANVDWDACQDVIEHVTHDALRWANLTDDEDPPTVVGLAYHVFHREDLYPISERVLGLEAPSDAFVGDCEWLKTKLKAVDGGSYEFCPIPVRIHLELETTTEDMVANVLRQIVQCVVAQGLYTRAEMHREPDRAARSSRFQVAELRMAPSLTVSVEALDALAKLVELGVNVPCLPPLSHHARSTRLPSVIRSLQMLLVPRCQNASPSTIATVQATDHMPADAIPCLFSAIAGDSCVSRFELQAVQSPRIAASERLWEWIAYALFSYHGAERLKNIALDTTSITDAALEGMERVISTDNPWAVLFDSSFEIGRWVEADTFHMQRPDDDAPRDSTVFRTLLPIHVPVIDQYQSGAQSRCRVLLPGCGEAWVADAVFDDGYQEKAIQTLCLELRGIVQSRVDKTLSLVRLVGSTLQSLVISTCLEVVDMTDWLRAVPRICPHLERLELPKTAEIRHFHGLVEAAEAGDFHLCSLWLRRRLSLASCEINKFLNVLCDVHHPLTKQLKEINLKVSMDKLDELRPTWYQLLDHNRTLHTISLSIFSSDAKRLEEHDAIVAVRSGPLGISSKLAFLSVIHDPSTTPSARGQLDTNVIAIVFAFAAQHRVRKVTIYNRTRETSL